MARNGKIARLPLALREEINQRLLDAQTTASILDWLNQQPEARAVVAEHFEGTAIDRHSLGEWRLGGYQEWLQDRKLAATTRSILDEAWALEEVTGEKRRLSEAMQKLLSAELAATMRVCLAQTMEPEARWERLRELLKQVDRVRRTDVLVSREKREEDKWDWAEDDITQKLEEKEEKEEREKLLARFQAEREVPVRAARYGGTEVDWHIAHCVTALKLGLEFPPKKPGQTWKPEAVTRREEEEKKARQSRTPQQERDRWMAEQLGMPLGNEEGGKKNEEGQKNPGARSQNSESGMEKTEGPAGPSHAPAPEAEKELPAKASGPEALARGPGSAAVESDVVGGGDIAAADPSDTAALRSGPVAQEPRAEAERALPDESGVPGSITRRASGEEQRGVKRSGERTEDRIQNLESSSQKAEVPDALAELKHKLQNLKQGEVANTFIEKYVKSLESTKPGAGGVQEMPEELRGKLRYGPFK